ncbi:Major Facilitator Superfamily protein [Tsuneonella dongtanensis]|uniref:Major Facilitator Superfamily protein n=1 Tax=Tsuneonella dongtanensis TaxID=692370 RepID=A0A1B2AH01_9SPHN|nr:MFS transporter [Tsuneonella dongtanensis]ANY21391.1 Major Facilitator Superfamily protein [Tsuneonella dongtanensis]
MTAASSLRSVDRFVPVYALAWAGGAIAYTPFLTLLLPERIADAVGAESAVDWLSALAFCGAIAASVANIAFGYLSDLTGTRRGWIAGGMVISCLLLALFPLVDGFWPLIGLIVLWQFGLNMMLAPLAALAGDVVPDQRKGTLGGFLAFAPALGAASGALVTWPGLAGAEIRPGIVAVLVAVCVAPVLFSKLPAPVDPDLLADPQTHSRPKPPARMVVARMWLARLSLQVAEAALFAFLYLWFRAVDPSLGASSTAIVFGVVLAISAPIALGVGRWADRHDRPLAPLSISAVVSAVGLGLMAAAQGTLPAIAAYGLFGVASSVFLALHSAQTLRILPRPARRGRDLGLFNLTNTTPSLIMPALALAMVPTFGFPGLFAILAGLAALAAVLVPRRTG